MYFKDQTIWNPALNVAPQAFLGSSWNEDSNKGLD